MSLKIMMKHALVALALYDHPPSPPLLQDIPFKTMDGKEASLKDYSGKVVLVVNVASKCGLTQAVLRRSWGAALKNTTHKGLAILGFPATTSTSQEPGTNEEIQKFARTIIARHASHSSTRSA